MIKRFYCISNLKVENIHQFFSKIDNILDYLNKLDLINYKYIGNFFIGCEKWFISYGHFKDEMFTLFDFGKKFNKKQIDNYKYLQDYPISQEQVSNYRIPGSNHNYKKIDELLFKGSLFNCGIEVEG